MALNPILVWFRRDLRLSDNSALSFAVESGRPIVPVFIRDQLVDRLGAAAKWRLGLALEYLQRSLSSCNSQLILRSGDPLAVLTSLRAETGSDCIVWNRDFDPAAIDRDIKIKSALKNSGADVHSFSGFLLFEPHTVKTKQGGFYKVYSPFWRAVRGEPVTEPVSAPKEMRQTAQWPVSDTLAGWELGKAMNRGAEIVRPYASVGEAQAHDRLRQFVSKAIFNYRNDRDFPAKPATSGLSENLTYGEISPRQIWHAGQWAMSDGAAGAEQFLKELVWREFSYHLAFHSPDFLTQNWREGWDDFPWITDESSEKFVAWKQGRTGVRMVDAAMREMYVTGKMHNRARMIVASYLTKHLMVHWRLGQKWFEDCLIDWDPAANAMGWQWVAGCGPDAAPFFRIFNPDGQAKKFDQDETYQRRWLAEAFSSPSETAMSYFDAVPKSWGLSASDPHPDPVIELHEGRETALAAYKNRGP